MVRAIGDKVRRALQAQASPLNSIRLRSLSPLLLVIPHPDDEVLGCGGLIAEASDLNLDVRIVYLTDGAASHRGSPTWPPDRLARVRRQEALQALDVLGVGAEDVLFLDWPDAAPNAPDSPAFGRSIGAISRWRNRAPRSIWAPYINEDHCDHRAAWGLACAVRRLWTSSPPTMFEYLVWGWNAPGVGERLRGRALWRLSCAHQIARRRRALVCHATQLGSLIDDATQSFALPQALTALTDCPTEIYLES